MSSHSEGTPVVHIFGAFEGAQPVFSVVWAPDDPKNRRGMATGTKKLTAELTALAVVLETAVINRIRVVRIRHTSSNLSEELKNTKSKQGLDSECLEILREIRRLEVYVTMHLEEVSSDEFNVTMKASKRATGEQDSSGIRIVDIFGAFNESSPTSGYGVYWGKDDPRNTNGRPPGAQSAYRAHLMALNVALSQALHENEELIIRSRCPGIHQIITSFRSGTATSLWSGSKHDDLLGEINGKLSQFTHLVHLLPRRSLEVEGQLEAEHLASEFSQSHNVSICGLGTASDGFSRFSVFWGLGNPKNEAGWESGNHSSFCSEIVALKRALICSLDNTFLTVNTRSKQLICFASVWRHEWKKFGWPTPSGGRMKCMEVCKEVDAMLEKITVTFRPGNEEDTVSARKKAEDVVGPPIVFTSAKFTNEDQSIAAYNVFWNSDDERNKSRRMSGDHCLVRAKLVAIFRAMEIALQHGITQLIVKTDYSLKDGIDNELINEIRSLKRKFTFIKFRKGMF